MTSQDKSDLGMCGEDSSYITLRQTNSESVLKATISVAQ
jgi:hypothetical protein